MLKHWRQKQGSGATYQALCDALQHHLVLRQDLAEQFCYIKDGISEVQLPACPVPEQVEAEEALGAMSAGRLGTSVALREDQEDSCRTGSCLKRKMSEQDHERGYLPVKISCAAADSRNSHLEAPQKSRERVNRYMTDLAREVLESSKFEICSSKGIAEFSAYLLEKLQVLVERVEPSSIKITVNCRTKEILEMLWNDYKTGHLNKVAEECFITDKMKEELDMETIKLTTTILEEDYSACKLSLMEISGVLESVKKNQEEPTHFTEEKVSIETDDRKLKTELEEDDEGISSSSSSGCSSEASSYSSISSSSSSSWSSRGSYDSGHVDQQRTEGKRIQQAFENALKHLEVQVFRGQIRFVGQDRAGKTSLKKSLLGLRFDPKEQSTEGIEVDTALCEIEVDEVKNWHSTHENKPALIECSKDIAKMVTEKLCQFKYKDFYLEEESEVSDSEESDLFEETVDQPNESDISSSSAKAEVSKQDNVSSGEHVIDYQSENEPDDPDITIDATSPPDDFTHIHLWLLNAS